MGAIFLWKSPFTEGKIATENDPEMASPAFLVFKFFEGRPPDPLFRLVCFNFSIQHTAQHKTNESDVYNSGIYTQTGVLLR